MIEEIRMANVGVIERATLPLGPGFTAVTGETGAGKTMVVTALGLLLGSRAEAGMVRSGAQEASVQAHVVLPLGHPALERAIAAGATIDEDGSAAALLLSRTITAQGRSRAFVGGQACPVAVLAEIGSQLVTVHGQNDQNRLRHATAQRQALDAAASADFSTLLARYQTLFERWREVADRLRRVRHDACTHAQEIEELQAALSTIAEVEPQAGEDEQLRAESMKLTHQSALRFAAEQANQALAAQSYSELEVPDVLTLLAMARKELDQVAEHDQELKQVGERLAHLSYQVSDIVAELGQYLETLDPDVQARLAVVEERRAQLAALARRWGPTIDDVLAWAERAAERLAVLDRESGGEEALAERERELDGQVAACATELTAARQSAAGQLAGRVGQELAALAMPQAQLNIEVSPTERSLTGADEVGFFLQPHAGSPFRPLGKSASGGELSRVMLALEVVFASHRSVPTYVFDEVDAGVGGKAAVEIGRRLAQLAEQVQVITVTHLPQVAAFANNHVQVTKSSDGSVTSSGLHPVEEDERVRELARMLAGYEDSSSARAHAQELLDLAHGGAVSGGV